MRDFMFAEKAGKHYLYNRANGNGRAASHSFLIDECRITEFFSGYIVNLVKQIRSTSPDMKLVDEELYGVQAWKKASWTLWLIDPSQVQ